MIGGSMLSQEQVENYRRLHVLLNLIRGLYKALDSDWRKAASEVGLTPCQQHLLWILSFRNGSTLTELSEIGVWHVSTVMSMVERMEKNGLVTKVVDLNDARTKRIFVTEKGSRVRKETLKGEEHFRLLSLMNNMNEQEVKEGTKILQYLVSELLGERFIEFVNSSSEQILNKKEELALE
ncbi:MarR family protein [Desulforamulus aeronauticus DSM 10349]|uniref:MarR family protein n=1 Tax=Desulforamulus aeronauticus DSM 10349 TaxID=1121421 RepID=A0A1M6SMZ1_9FIRM|nr:MarR family protein [Desulforamulus aeronauticus DSM 10349]